MNSTKLAFNVQIRQWEERHQFVSLWWQQSLDHCWASQVSAVHGWSTSKKSWFVKNSDIHCKSEEEWLELWSQVTSHVRRHIIITLWYSPKILNHRLQTLLLSCKESLIVLSLYCIQCLSVSVHEYHILKADYLSVTCNIWNRSLHLILSRHLFCRHLRTDYRVCTMWNCWF